MRSASFLLLATCLGTHAQIVPRVGGVVGAGSLWRGNIGGILGQQPNKVTPDDLGRFENYLVGAGAYCSALTAADYQAHRLMMRSMAAYVRTMNQYSRDAQMRASLGRISGRISALPCAWAGGCDWACGRGALAMSAMTAASAATIRIFMFILAVRSG